MKGVRGGAASDSKTPDSQTPGSASPDGPAPGNSSPDSLSTLKRAKFLPPLLAAVIKAAPGMALAFSGGLDSRFLAHAACLLLPAPDWPLLFHVRGPHVPPDESREAVAWARSRGLKTTLVDFDPLSRPQVRANGRDRCYHCKLAMFRAIALAAGRPILLHDGSNASDSKAFRPGLAALKELGVRSPLAEAGLDKEEIMRLAALSGLERPRQRARPCLLTRFAYDLAPERSALEALAATEKTLEALLGEWGDADGAPDFRLRLVAGKRASGGRNFGLPLAAWSAELHVAAPLPSGARKALAGALEAAGCGTAPLICLESVSGHFDGR